MKDILITSSALILAILVIRRLFRKRISARIRYALWGLVLIRLLIPFNIPSGIPIGNFSLLTITAPIEHAIDNQLTASLQPAHETELPAFPANNTVLPEAKAFNDYTADGTDYAPSEFSEYITPQIDGAYILGIIWKAGIATAVLFFCFTNVSFWIRIKKCRTAFIGDLPIQTGRKVYLLPDDVLVSPCLFFRSIYLTPKVLESENMLRHVLCHEEMHAKHLDPLWSCLKALCVAIYWFNPFVWLAAYYAKIDCELACDESTISYLGEEERISYGETLLSLISMNKTANPFLSATTMTFGKKQLENRIDHIAHRRKQTAPAVLAALLLAGIVSACTFSESLAPEQENRSVTGNQAQEMPSAGTDKAQDTTFLTSAVQTGVTETMPLSGEELQWFNEEFFNINDSYYPCLTNQFANPAILYDTPQDIDLYELFYNGVDSAEGAGAPDVASDEEIREVLDMEPDMLPCPVFKLTASTMNDCLKKYLGLNIDELDKAGLEHFTYSNKYDAYYHTHGDTNYCGNIFFYCGEKKKSADDTIIKLYQSDGISWYCVTLRENNDTSHGYQESPYVFVSNQTCEKPAIPTLMPKEPVLTIPLRDLEPYTAPVVSTENRPSSDFDGNYENRLANWDLDGRLIGAYRGTDGLVRIAEKLDDESYHVFLTADDAPFECVSFYNNLFGHNGFYADYFGAETGEGTFAPCRDYFYFDENNAITLLCRVWTNISGGAFQMDLDGDGTDELVSDSKIFFERNGRIYQADICTLVQDSSSENFIWATAGWNANSKCLVVETTESHTDGISEYQRFIYFDGQNLLVF